MKYLVDLTFTGERAVEGKTPERIWLDHVARYEFACDYVENKKVLDIACGTGYGAAILRKSGASYVLGVDISNDAISFAKAQYSEYGIEFKTGDILETKLPESSFDVVVSFETLEHINDQDAGLLALKRLAKPLGKVIISSPNRKLTSPGKGISGECNNAFHAIEYTETEFAETLSKYFFIECLYGQRGVKKILLLPIISVITNRFLFSLYNGERGQPQVEKCKESMEYRYVIAVCQKKEL